MPLSVSRYARYVTTAVWVVAGGWLLGTTAATVRAAWLIVPAPPEVVQEDIVRNVPDAQGRRALFRIMLFSDEFRWRINSADAVEDGRGIAPLDLDAP